METKSLSFLLILFFCPWVADLYFTLGECTQCFLLLGTYQLQRGPYKLFLRYFLQKVLSSQKYFFSTKIGSLHSGNAGMGRWKNRQVQIHGEDPDLLKLEFS